MIVSYQSLRRIIREAIADSDVREIVVGDTPCSVEIADTDGKRARGLMGRKNIPDGTGMLFTYPSPDRLSFWMKGTPSPLSIAFIDETGKIIKISDMHPFDESSVTSPPGCTSALEVPQGWFKRKGIIPGDHVRLS